jgi:hypothetical protein
MDHKQHTEAAANREEKSILASAPLFASEPNPRLLKSEKTRAAFADKDSQDHSNRQIINKLPEGTRKAKIEGVTA